METEQVVPASREANPAAEVIRQALRNKGFVACAALLLVLTVGFLLITWRYNFVKEALPLKVPLNRLSQAKLAPYKLIKPVELQSDVLGPLGTDQYVQWILQEPSSPDGKGPGRIIMLFVTYYTGSPDAVPHIPDVCYVGSGFERKTEVLDEITIRSDEREIPVPVQVLEFVKDTHLDPGKRLVLYTFHANGQFRKDRTDVRWAIGSLTDHYAYFSKVEVSMGLEAGRVSKEEAVDSAKRLLQVALPALLEDHWPDWEAANRQSATRPAGTPE